jgi:ATP-dependent helicase/DNAse subunit B
MRLLSGPAGSGKTTHILNRMRRALGEGDFAIRLLVPTATMAQHLQNRLAREGFVFPASLVQTLSGFLRDYAGSAREVSSEVLYLIVEEAARRVARPEFSRVTRFHGFSNSLAHTIDEFASAGCDSARLATCLPECPLGEAFLAVYREVDRSLASRGLATRARRLELAAAEIEEHGLNGISTICLDGFHALPDPELRVVAALGRHTDLTLTLGDDDITPALRGRLAAIGFTEERARPSRAHAAIALVKAPGVERETEEIARRILEQAAAGRPFREMGVIVRAPDVYVPVLRSTLERFGVPARFYFDSRLEHHPVVRFLAGAVECMLGGWDHARTLAVLRLTPRFVDFAPADAFDFEVRAQIPNSGLSELRALLLGEEGQPRRGAERLLHKLESLAALEEWRGFALTPADWAARAATLRHLFRPARPMEPATHEFATEWRSRAAALDLFDAALAEAAAALDDSREMPLEEYWRAVKSVLRLKPLRVEDGRRNVVHVMSVHEARQWVLPIVFVCGMVEKQFPQVHRQDPFFPEAARSRLNDADIRVRTAAESEREERALFDTATSRATMLLTLSYPEFDARGERNLPSIYLEDVLAAPVDSVPVRPVPRRMPEARGAARIAAPELLAHLERKTVRISPSAIESYLQCPFQYFARRLMRLETAPLRPEKRLSFLEQGNIVHEVLAEWWHDPRDLAARFERIFARHLAENHIPNGYHTERLRNAMLDDLLRFGALDPWPRAAFQSETERDFAFPLAEGLEIFGRIDRLDVAPDGRAFVLDYKYSAAANIKKKVENQNLMQAPLYMMAARHANVRPSGMFYVGVKGGIEYAGWSDAPLMDALPLPENWLEQTQERTLRIVEEMRQGRVEVAPADRDNCRFCDARDVCRIEVAGAATIGEGA